MPGQLSLVITLIFLIAGIQAPLLGSVSSVQQFTITDGLSNSSVNVVFQDSRGFLWIGTEDGLNRYDGYRFDVFRYDGTKIDAISGNRVVAIAEDGFGNIWVGTRNRGISVLSRETGRFIQYRHNKNNPGSLPEDGVYAFHISRDGSVWVKTEKYLSRFRAETNDFQSYGHYANVFKPAQAVRFDIVEESDSTFLLGTGDGLNRFNKNSGLFERLHTSGYLGEQCLDPVYEIQQIGRGKYLAATKSGLRYFEPGVFMMMVAARNHHGGTLSANAICSDRLGRIWIGTNRGLESFIPQHFAHQPVVKKRFDLASIIPHEVTCIFEDSSGLIWVGTRFKGLFKVNANPPVFSFIGEGDEREWPMQSYNIRSVITDRSGKVWAGTLNSGLYEIDRSRGTLRHFIVNHQAYRDRDDAVESLYEDSLGNLWIGTNSGLYILDQTRKSVREFHYGYDMKFATLLRNNRINSILADSTGTMWLATQFGLYALRNGRMTSYFKGNDADGLLSDEINALTIDMHGRIWIGSTGGVNYIDPKSGKIVALELNNGKKVFNEQVLSLTCDQVGRLLIGTRAGLNVLSFGEDAVISLEPILSLDNEMITSVMTDDKRRVWVSSSRGISMLSVEGVVRSFDSTDGLQAELFNIGSGYRAPDGELFFGSVNGLCWLHPDSIRVNLYRPRVALTDISVCKRGDCEPLKNGRLEELKLKFRPGMMLEVSYTALEFTQPHKNSYMLMLEGYDKDWRPVTTSNTVAFSNLTPGQYTLRIMAANNDFTWNNQPYELPLIITPPLWMTNYAYAFYLLVIVFVMQMLVNYRIRHYKKANRSLTEKSIDKQRLEEQRKALALINQSLTDSINYATRIQSAMIPTERVFRLHFAHSFIYFRPRDLVSGDFYWLCEREDKLFVAAVDCTGHGVPGAFMSIIGMDLLKNIIVSSRVDSPSTILKLLSRELDNTLRQNHHSPVSQDAIKDGMDMVLLVIDRKNQTMDFSGAVNGLYLVRNNELQMFKGDRLPIGRLPDGMAPEYTETRIPLEKDDVVYLFTDGYVDQFGGDEMKKFKYRRFRHLLLNIHGLEPDDQKAILHQKLEDWKGAHEQVDDILVIGFKPLSS